MTVKISPLFNDAQLDSSGNPASGYKLFTYTASSSTKQTTYQDSAAGSSHTNPIVLNSRGEPPAPIWLTAGVAYKFVFTSPTDTDPPVSAIRSIDNVSGVNDTTTVLDEWVAGPTPTFVSATSFTLVGDQTSTFHLGRRLKSTNSGGTVYSTIITTAFGALTTVTVVNDSSVLDSGLSAVSYGLVRADNTSISPQMVYRKGTAVASAATTNIWGIVGDYVHITGVVTITSLGTAPYAGARREIVFDGALTLTHNATTLVIPGGQNITTAANDVAVVRADTTANMVLVSYARANGVQVFASGSATGAQTANTVYAGPTSGAAAAPTFRALVGIESSMVLLGSKTSASAASVTLGTTGAGVADIQFDWTAYDEYELHFVDYRPATDATNLQFQISQDGGSTFITTATYANTQFSYNGSASSITTNSAVTANTITPAAQSNSAGALGTILVLKKPSQTATAKLMVTRDVVYINSAGNLQGGQSTCDQTSTAAYNGMKILYSSGNIASGTIYVYGIRKS